MCVLAPLRASLKGARGRLLYPGCREECRSGPGVYLDSPRSGIPRSEFLPTNSAQGGTLFFFKLKYGYSQYYVSGIQHSNSVFL